MAEQERNDEAHASGDDVSMDEILTSLRNILEEDSEGDPGQSKPAEAETEPIEDAGLPEGDNASGDELVLTDVVEEGDDTHPPETAVEDSAEPDQAVGAASGEGSGEGELDALFGRWDREESGVGEAEPEPGSAPEPELGPTAGEASETAEGLGETSGEAGAIPEEPTAPEETFELGGSEPELSQEVPSEETAPATAASPEVAAPPLDSESIQETVETTVREQIEQATADLDNRLAEALEPKLREALQGYLEERLPNLLRELAEAEIERIKKGE